MENFRCILHRAMVRVLDLFTDVKIKVDSYRGQHTKSENQKPLSKLLVILESLRPGRLIHICIYYQIQRRHKTEALTLAFYMFHFSVFNDKRNSYCICK